MDRKKNQDREIIDAASSTVLPIYFLHILNIINTFSDSVYT